MILFSYKGNLGYGELGELGFLDVNQLLDHPIGIKGRNGTKMFPYYIFHGPPKHSILAQERKSDQKLINSLAYC